MPVEKIASVATISGSSSQLSIGSTPSASAKPSTTTRFSARLNEREQHDRERDHHARELDLAHEVLAVNDAAHRAGRRFAEEREQHDRAEQLRAVVRRARGVRVVDVRDLA